MPVKETVKRIIGRRGRLLVRRLRTRRWPITKVYRAHLRGMRCLEIGGERHCGLWRTIPDLFLLRRDGQLQFCRANSLVQRSRAIFPHLRVGRNALEIEPGAYDCVIASHCLEHIANPIKALMSGSAFFAGKVFCCSSFLIATIHLTGAGR